MKTTHKHTLIAGALGTVLLVGSTAAMADRDARIDLSAMNIDLNAASALALSEVPGAVVEAELEREDGRLAWEFEIVDAAGERMEVLIDATDGSLISAEADDDRDGWGFWDRDDDDDRDNDNDNDNGSA